MAGKDRLRKRPKGDHCLVPWRVCREAARGGIPAREAELWACENGSALPLRAQLGPAEGQARPWLKGGGDRVWGSG